MITRRISQSIISEIARDTFGSSTRVESAREIIPERKHGITRQPDATRNLPYYVRLAGMPHAFVFRFNRGPGDDLYEQESAYYTLIAEKAGVPVPQVYRVDRSRQIAPTSYMILEYKRGEHWQYLVHPDNPETTAEEKEAILKETGALYARVHAISRKAEAGDEEAQTVSFMLNRLEGAVRQGHIDIDLAQIQRCRQAVAQEPYFKNESLSLCLADTEIFFSKERGTWKLAFVCDAEWVEYRDFYSDLAPALSGPRTLWELDRPLEVDAKTASGLPFFAGYEAKRPLDYEKLVSLPAYYQLGLWSYLASEESTPEKKAWLKTHKEPLIAELVDIVAARV